MKTCNHCHKKKKLSEFYKFARSPDGHQHSCKKCQLQWQKEKRDRTKSGEHQPKPKLQHPEGQKICTRCLVAKPATLKFFAKLTAGYLELMPTCKECDQHKKNRRRRDIGWARRLVEYARGRHKGHTSEPFDLTAEFLETMYERQQGKCAWFGVRMTTEVGGDQLRLITVDRQDCSRGYTQDNAVLVCKAANQARGNATPEEFVLLLDEVRG